MFWSHIPKKTTTLPQLPRFFFFQRFSHCQRKIIRFLSPLPLSECLNFNCILPGFQSSSLSLSEDCISYFTEKIVEIKQKFHQSLLRNPMSTIWSLTLLTSLRHLTLITAFFLLKHFLAILMLLSPKFSIIFLLFFLRKF